MIAIVGGSKISTKIDLLENLVGRVDILVIGGAMANTFLLAEGLEVGKSLAERDMSGTVNTILAKAATSNCTIIVPVDGVVAHEFKANAAHRTLDVNAMDPQGMILDVGAKTVDEIKAAIDGAKTLVWNGPLGAFETVPFDAGTTAVAKYVADRTKAGNLVSVAGGGDTVSALAHAGVKDDFTYVSTAGGAFLEWMEGKDLPGVAALKK